MQVIVFDNLFPQRSYFSAVLCQFTWPILSPPYLVVTSSPILMSSRARTCHVFIGVLIAIIFIIFIAHHRNYRRDYHHHYHCHYHRHRHRHYNCHYYPLSSSLSSSFSPPPSKPSPGRYVLKIHFFIESGLKMIQFKFNSKQNQEYSFKQIFIQ